MCECTRHALVLTSVHCECIATFLMETLYDGASALSSRLAANLSQLSQLTASLALFYICFLSTTANGETLDWHHTTASGSIVSSDVTTDGNGDIYVAGRSLTYTNFGKNTLFLLKYDAAGDRQWSKEFGEPHNEFINGVSTDHLGNVFTASSVGFGTQDSDAQVRKFDVDGNLKWLWHSNAVGRDGAAALSADGFGNVYVVGEIPNRYGDETEGFVGKLNGSGELLWSRS